MPLALPNRLSQLNSLVPTGSPYNIRGVLLAEQDAPFEIPFTGLQPNFSYDLLLNGARVAKFKSDAEGELTVNIELQRDSDYEIVLFPVGGFQRDQKRIWVSVRSWNLFQTVSSEMVELEDNNMAVIYDGLRLDTAAMDELNNYHGQNLFQANDIEYGLIAFRENLRNLRNGYLNKGGSIAGIKDAVGAFSFINPKIDYGRGLPIWWLDQEISGEFKFRTRLINNNLNNLNEVALNDLGFLAGNSANLAVLNVSLVQPDNLLVTFPLSWDAGNIIVTGVSKFGVKVQEVIIADPGNSAPSIFSYSFIDGIFKETIGTSSDEAYFGYANTRFIKVTNISPFVETDLTHTLEYRPFSASPGREEFRLNGQVVRLQGNEVEGVNNYRLFFPRKEAEIMSNAVEPYDLSGNASLFSFEIDGRGRVDIDFNDYIITTGADPGERASLTINRSLAFGNGDLGSKIILTDAEGRSNIFEWVEPLYTYDFNQNQVVFQGYNNVFPNIPIKPIHSNPLKNLGEAINSRSDIFMDAELVSDPSFLTPATPAQPAEAAIATFESNINIAGREGDTIILIDTNGNINTFEWVVADISVNPLDLDQFIFNGFSSLSDVSHIPVYDYPSTLAPGTVVEDNNVVIVSPNNPFEAIRDAINGSTADMSGVIVSGELIVTQGTPGANGNVEVFGTWIDTVNNILNPTPGPPQNITPPVLSGIPNVGQFLSVTEGVWSGLPVDYPIFTGGVDGVAFQPATSDDNQLIITQKNEGTSGNTLLNGDWYLLLQGLGGVPDIIGVKFNGGIDRVGNGIIDISEADAIGIVQSINQELENRASYGVDYNASAKVIQTIAGRSFKIVANNNTESNIDLNGQDLGSQIKIYGTGNSGDFASYAFGIDLASSLEAQLFLGRESSDYIDIEVNHALEPNSTKSDDFEFLGSRSPDNIITNDIEPLSFRRSSFSQEPGLSMLITGDYPTMDKLCPEILEKKGQVISAHIVGSFINEDLSTGTPFQFFISYDGVNFLSFSETLTSNVEPTLVGFDNFEVGGYHKSFISRIYVPIDAKTAIVRVLFDGFSPGDQVVIDDFFIYERNSTSKFLNNNTVTRGSTYNFLRSEICVWFPNLPNEQEIIDIGMTEEEGHVQRIAPANTISDVIDYSEIDNATEQTVNVVGVWNSQHFNASSLDNFEVVTASPRKATYIRPINPSEIGPEPLVFSAISPYRATLPEPSSQDLGNPELRSVIFSSEIPEVGDFFSYIDENTVEISDENYSTANFYSLLYNRLTRIETEVMDLGESYLDYTWYLDVRAYIRQKLVEKQELVTETINFVDNFEASLKNPTEASDNLSLVRTNGVIVEDIPANAISFINNTRIRLAQRFFDIDFIYTITYNSIVIERVPSVDLTLEYRTSSISDNVTSEEWREFRLDDIADTRYTLSRMSNKRYVQFRVTANNVERIEDLHIYSITARGYPYPLEDIETAALGFKVIEKASALSLATLNGEANGVVPITARGSLELTGTAEGDVPVRANSIAYLTSEAEGSLSKVVSTAQGNSELTSSASAAVSNVPAEASTSHSSSGSVNDGLVTVIYPALTIGEWDEEFFLSDINAGDGTLASVGTNNLSSLFPDPGTATLQINSPFGNMTAGEINQSTGPLSGIESSMINRAVLIDDSRPYFQITESDAFVGWRPQSLSSSFSYRYRLIANTPLASGAPAVYYENNRANSSVAFSIYFDDGTQTMRCLIRCYGSGGAIEYDNTLSVPSPGFGGNWMIIDLLFTQGSTTNTTDIEFMVNGQSAFADEVPTNNYIARHTGSLGHTNFSMIPSSTWTSSRTILYFAYKLLNVGDFTFTNHQSDLTASGL